MKQGPKKIKHKKVKKGSLSAFSYRSNKLKFGTLGLKAAESGVINLKQLESARKVISKKTKRKAKLWIKIFPSTPITKKSTGIRMGKGVGLFSHWGAKIKGGNIIFEIEGSNVFNLIEALKAGGEKLPIKTIIFN